MKKFLSMFLAAVLLLTAAVPAMAAEPVQGKYVALTFDDGPNPNYTPRLLDELKARNVKCTFFMLGKFAHDYPELAKRVHDEGHQVASHTYNHTVMPQQSTHIVQREIEGTRVMLESITGENNFMIRIPYGYYTQRVLDCCNAPVILWSVDGTNGNSNYTADSLYNNMLRQVHDGAIILLHDTSNSNVNAALRVIDTLQEQGYTFVTVEELFRIKGVAPQNNAVYHSVKSAGTYYDESLLDRHWAYGSISYAMETGLMQGDGQGFKPNEYMTRAMAVTLLWRACGEEKVREPAGFADVPEDSWYYDAVNWGADTGIVKGMLENYFVPDDMISREQFCTLVMRLADYRETELSSDAAAPEYCDDLRVSGWAAESVSRLWKAGFVSANDTSAFRPQDSITRAEAAELLAWYFQITNAPSR